MLSKEVTELMSLSRAILTTENIVQHPREVNPIWRCIRLEGEIYHDYIDDIDSALRHYLSDLLKIKENICALDVDLMDNFEENALELGEMIRQFKDNY